MKDDYIDIPFGRPYRLTDNSLDKICVSLAKSLNCRVQEIHVSYDRNKGYYFYGPYDICIADLLFEGNDYRGVQIYGGIVEDLKVQLEEERRRVAEETRKREFGNLMRIQDNYPKYVVSMTPLITNNDYDGIKHIHLRNFLKNGI